MAQAIGEIVVQEKTAFAEVVRYGEKITLPDNMRIEDAIKILKAKQKDEEEVINLMEVFDVFVAEGLYAMAKTLDNLYGWFQQIKTPGFFGSNPPSLISVKTGYKQTVQVPWGRFLVPGIPEDDGYFETGAQQKPGCLIKFQLTATLKKKHSRQFHELCAAIRRQLTTTSLYKGKAVSIAFYAENGSRIKFPEPDFPSITKLAPGSMVFSSGIETALNVNLFTPITETDLVRSLGIPLKRSILLAGSYGTGKTLIATRTKELAINNGWTFVVCPSAMDFTDCVRFAQDYQPAIVFCEDIDRVSDGDRDAAMDNILNTVDGIDAKNTEIMLVLTTNEVENIHPAMVRPGRCGDAVIFITNPDAEAVGRLIAYYGGASLSPDVNVEKVSAMLDGSTPAIISEAVERAKLAAVSLGEVSNGQIRLSERSLIAAVETMQMHRKLLDRKPKPSTSGIEVFANIVGEYLKDGITDAMETTTKAGFHLDLPDYITK